ncbi:uncharacterized protein [Nicotiana tomentosiformis]|uniref:uncharacterized protein n=1 Tax=Nicotiana tomentosiformis TaxID=4098 RepID=UPI00388C4D44
MTITTRSGKLLQGENEQVVEVEDFEQEVEAQVEVPNVIEVEKLPKKNIPFVEAFQEMPGFAKYLKDFITKNKTTKNEVVNMTPGNNLMPLPIYKQARLGMLRPTSMGLQMADRSIKRPVGIVDDVLVKVGKFLLLADIVILDCAIDKEIPIILGRPFLATDRVEDVVEVKMEEECLGEALAAILVNFDGEGMERYVELVNALEGIGSYTYAVKKLSLDLENRVTPPAKPSIIEPPQFELKPLPPHLRYKFLGSNETLPIIVSSLLNDVHVEHLLDTLREHRQAIGWTIVDIRGISAGICEHKI